MRKLGVALLAILSAGTALAQQPGWIADKKTACKVWNEQPVADEYITWSGACANSIANGTGMLVWHAKGQVTDRYEGELRNGRENGQGTYYWPNGDYYQGAWRNGRAHGTGTRVNAKGETFTGQWAEGCFNDGKRRSWIGTTREQCGFK
jgi:hypothetical protein